MGIEKTCCSANRLVSKKRCQWPSSRARGPSKPFSNRSIRTSSETSSMSLSQLAEPLGFLAGDLRRRERDLVDENGPISLVRHVPDSDLLGQCPDEFVLAVLRFYLLEVDQIGDSVVALRRRSHAGPLCARGSVCGPRPRDTPRTAVARPGKSSVSVQASVGGGCQEGTTTTLPRARPSPM